MYYYGMTKNMYLRFYGGHGDISWNLTVGLLTRGLSEIFYLGAFLSKRVDCLLIVINSLKVKKSL